MPSAAEGWHRRDGCLSRQAPDDVAVSSVVADAGLPRAARRRAFEGASVLSPTPTAPRRAQPYLPSPGRWRAPTSSRSRPPGAAGSISPRVGSGTVSGSPLCSVAPLAPVVAAGCPELEKGALGPVLMARGRVLAAGGGGAAALVRHSWSPLLGFAAGGRRIGAALGSTVPVAPGPTALPGLTRGRGGTLAGLIIAPEMLAEQVAGNRAPAGGYHATAIGRRLLRDRD